MSTANPMKLVVIYGPPAVGKLSVAMELATMTNYKLFHNHVSVDFVKTIFEFGTPTFNRLVNKYRIELLENAAREQISTIFTSAWIKGSHQQTADNLRFRIEQNGGKVCFVYLYAPREVLIERVDGKSRQDFGKIRDADQLKEFLRSYDLPKVAPIDGSFTIENSQLSPNEAAKLIRSHFNLEPSKKPATKVI
ncbi:MAG: AAA family ATPase [Candidatus Micrarchaeota archaeon]|nr:AAA family ATPase [Candidatus Micrarchaeota archaeon]